MSTLSPYQHSVPLRLWQGLEETKVCFGLVTRTAWILTCRRTAEDLNVTSSKLARYERLLNDIFPLVSPDVRTMIDDVRQQVRGIPFRWSFVSNGVLFRSSRPCPVLIKPIRAPCLIMPLISKREEPARQCTDFHHRRPHPLAR